MLAVLDGLERSSATVARMPSIARHVFPNLPAPTESYVIDRVQVPLPPLKKQAEARDFVDLLRLWDAAARVSAGCAMVGACRGASWELEGRRLLLEMAVDAQSIRFRFVLRAADGRAREGQERTALDRAAWPWQDGLPPKQLPAYQLQLIDKLVAAEWYPVDAPAFLAAATRSGFRDDAATTEGLAVVAAWLRHADEWGGVSRMLWFGCLEARTRRLLQGDRAAFEAFLGADPDAAAALMRGGGTSRPKGSPAQDATNGRDAASEAYRAAIGTAAQADCSFSIDTCRMAASGLPARANRVLRGASLAEATMARRLICNPRFGHLLADELRRARASIIQPPDGAASQPPGSPRR